MMSARQSIPQQVQGQIEGAVVQAAGYALLENFIQKGGRVLTPTLSTYLIPTVLDIPEQVEFDHPGIPRPDWPLRRPRHGRNALPAFCGGGDCRSPFGHRGLV